MNVVKVKLFGVGFLGIILGKIFLVSEFFLAVKRVRVNGNFRVRAENTLVICKNEGVDFNHVTIFFPEPASHLVFERSMHLEGIPPSISNSVSLIITKLNVFELFTILRLSKNAKHFNPTK